jgi:tripartite-type tricarboxylate transporter receptor subunit TctC
MFSFKKFLTTTFLLLSASVSVATEQNFVWTTVPTGSLEGSCRILWKEYDSKYNTVSTVMPTKPGLSGGLVVDDVLRSDKPNSMICMGPSQFLLNPLLYPGRTREDQLDPLIMAARWPFVWYVPSDSPVNSYQDLISYFKSLNRPINVGMFIPIFKVIEPIFAQHGITVNLVNFKSGPQQYPSLSDGTLDLAFDAGGGLQVANQTKKFKAIGYVDIANNPLLPGLKNFVDAEPDLRAIPAAGGLIIAVQRNMPDAQKRLLIERITKITVSEEYKSSIGKFNALPASTTAPTLLYNLETNRRIINRRWKD